MILDIMRLFLKVKTGLVTKNNPNLPKPDKTQVQSLFPADHQGFNTPQTFQLNKPARPLQFPENHEEAAYPSFTIDPEVSNYNETVIRKKIADKKNIKKEKFQIDTKLMSLSLRELVQRFRISDLEMFISMTQINFLIYDPNKKFPNGCRENTIGLDFHYFLSKYGNSMDLPVRNQTISNRQRRSGKPNILTRVNQIENYVMNKNQELIQKKNESDQMIIPNLNFTADFELNSQTPNHQTNFENPDFQNPDPLGKYFLLNLREYEIDEILLAKRKRPDEELKHSFKAIRKGVERKYREAQLEIIKQREQHEKASSLTQRSSSQDQQAVRLKDTTYSPQKAQSSIQENSSQKDKINTRLNQTEIQNLRRDGKNSETIRNEFKTPEIQRAIETEVDKNEASSGDSQQTRYRHMRNRGNEKSSAMHSQNVSIIQESVHIDSASLERRDRFSIHEEQSTNIEKETPKINLTSKNQHNEKTLILQNEKNKNIQTLKNEDNMRERENNTNAENPRSTTQSNSIKTNQSLQQNQENLTNIRKHSKKSNPNPPSNPKTLTPNSSKNRNPTLSIKKIKSHFEKEILQGDPQSIKLFRSSNITKEVVSFLKNNKIFLAKIQEYIASSFVTDEILANGSNKKEEIMRDDLTFEGFMLALMTKQKKNGWIVQNILNSLEVVQHCNEKTILKKKSKKVKKEGKKLGKKRRIIRKK